MVESEKECPKCKKRNSEFLYSEPAIDSLHGSDYAQRGTLCWYKCKSCGHQWSDFKPSGGPPWKLPIED